MSKHYDDMNKQEQQLHDLLLRKYEPSMGPWTGGTFKIGSAANGGSSMEWDGKSLTLNGQVN